MSDTTVTFSFPTPGLASLMGIWSVADGRLVHASTGVLLADNQANRELAGIAGDDSDEPGDYVFEVPAGTAAATLTLKIYLNPEWIDDEAAVGVTDPLFWDGSGFTGTPVESIGAYLTVAQANVLAMQMPAALVSSYNAADATARGNALVAASYSIDNAMKYQGRRYDPSQALEFPRVAYGSTSSPQAALNYPASSLVAGTIWDWDNTENAAVVPPAVKRACLLEADSILAGTRAGTLQAQHDGLASQGVGSINESYRGDAEIKPLCLAAHQLMNRYRLRSGQML